MGKILLIFVMSIVFMSWLSATPAQVAPTQSDIDLAISNGLAWLMSTQNVDGSWGGGDYALADTAAAVLAFENEGHFPGGGTTESGSVEQALDYIFSNAFIEPIYLQPAGDPDVDGNGQGVYFGYLAPAYETAMCVMAIVASNTPDRYVSTAAGVLGGQKYSDVVRDVVDWWAYGQGDRSDTGTTYQIDTVDPGRGGWYYYPHDNWGDISDNSISQWPVLGMVAAEQWDIYAPTWVKDELVHWVSYIQHSSGGSGYTAPEDCTNTAKTGGLLVQLHWLRDIMDISAKAQNAVDYIDQNWNISLPPGSLHDGFCFGYNKGDPYAMFSIFKGLSVMDVGTLPGVPPDGDWWGDYCQYIVDIQQNNGQWSGVPDLYGGGDLYDQYLVAGWYIVILQSTILPVDVAMDLPECAFDDAGYNVKVTYSAERFAVDGDLWLFRDGIQAAHVPLVGFQGSDTYVHPVASPAPGTYEWEAILDVHTADGVTANVQSTASLDVYNSVQINNIPDQSGTFISFDLDDYLNYAGNLAVTWSFYVPPEWLDWIVSIDGNNQVTVIAPPNSSAQATITFIATITCGSGIIDQDRVYVSCTGATDTAMSDLVTASGVIQPQGIVNIPGILVGPNMNFVTMMVGWQGSDIDLIAISPDSERIDEDWILNNPDSGVTYYADDTSAEIVIPDPIEGEWQAEIVGTDIPEDGEVYNFEATAFSPIYAAFSPRPKSRYSVGEPVNVGVYLAEGETDTGLKPIPGAAVESTITRPEGGTEKLTLYDDGAHNDAMPGDGIYSNDYLNTDVKGAYRIFVLAEGTLNEGEPDEQNVVRQLTASLRVDDAFQISELTPAPDSEVRNDPRPLISAFVQGPALYIDTIELTLDGNVVAHEYDAANQTVSCVPDALLPPGAHTVTLRVTDIEGYSIEAPPWSFTCVYDPISIDADSLIPAPGSTVPSNVLTPAISAVILGPETNIDKTSIMLTVDGAVVAHSYDHDTQTVSYTTPDMLLAGQHPVTLNLADILGNSVAETWSFNTVVPLILQKASYYILDTTLRLEFNRGIRPDETCFSKIGMEISDSGRWNIQLADEQGLQAEIAPDDPNAALIDIRPAVPAMISLLLAAFVSCKADDIDLLLRRGAFMDAYDGVNLPADVPLEMAAHGFVLGKAGDVTGNDAVTSYDAALILRATISGQTVFPVHEAAAEVSGLMAMYGHSVDVMMDIADVSGNGKISSYDAALALQEAAGSYASPGRIYDRHVRKCRLNVDRYDIQIPTKVGPPQVEISLDLDDVKHVYSADIVMTYDPQVLSLADVPETSSGWLLEQESAMGRLKISMARASEPNDGASLVTLRFDLDRHTGLSLQETISQLRITEFRLNDGILKTTIENLPENCHLLQNYPNPFNPETWIPYRLSEVADVTVTIYNMGGQVVRRLELGTKMPGHYTDQTRAAYWNGRNQSGERVASGIYFYQLQAGSYVSVRKMISRL